MRSPLLIFGIVTCMFLSVSAFAQSLNPEVIWAMPTSARIKCVSTVSVEYPLHGMRRIREAKGVGSDGLALR
ncbi:MAG: hypothetical protein KatS3mg022_3592 [Armatimonadota bacterium]|nr:MAG: hypothetical protein KatS3mg022_3592 [Armatimonadota bacterium]